MLSQRTTLVKSKEFFDKNYRVLPIFLQGWFSKRRGRAGDTIIEVLLAITVAAFAISISYAIANRSLQRAISARERNKALNVLENQISALKIRYKVDQENFKSAFAVPASETTVGTHLVFCLDEESSGPDDPDPDDPWIRQDNTSEGNFEDLRDTGSGGPYNPSCIKAVDDTPYFINTSAMITETSKTLNKMTVYKFMVRWPQAGSGQNGSSTIYYRL